MLFVSFFVVVCVVWVGLFFLFLCGSGCLALVCFLFWLSSERLSFCGVGGVFLGLVIDLVVLLFVW